MLITKPQSKDTTHQGYYASSSLTYLLAMISSNMALRWVAYPMQVIGKSAKPIPVMILGVLIGRKSYSIQRYVCVILIVLGVVLFMYKDNSPSKAQENVGLGEILLFLSLSMDGLTGAIQDRMRAASSPSGQQMMLAMNGWSSIIVAPLLLITGEGREFINFAYQYPTMLTHLALLALAGALGQLFIFLMVIFLYIFLHYVEFEILTNKFIPGIIIWTTRMFCCNNNTQILYSILFCILLWKYTQLTTVGWSYTSIFRFICRHNFWKEKAQTGRSSCQ